jgi:hypothetical protein
VAARTARAAPATYDAEYVALASLLGCRLVTVDARLRRGADRLGFVAGPTDLTALRHFCITVSSGP